MEPLSICNEVSQNATTWTLQNIKDLVYIVAAAVTMFLAFRGFSRWKKELRGKAYFDFSHRFLKVTYIIRDTLYDKRGIMYENSEYLDPGPPSEDQKEAEVKHSYKVYNGRLKEVLSAAQEYNSLLAEGEALFGENFREIAQQLIVKLNSYRYAIDQHLQYKANFIYDSKLAPMPEEYRANIYPIVHRQGGNGNDPFGDSIDAIIDELNKILVPLIRAK
ncbi:MAG: hypothetical protein ABJG47_13100 [Ekhidna sp.]